MLKLSSGKGSQGSPQKFLKAKWDSVASSSWAILQMLLMCYLTLYSLSLTSTFIYIINFVLIKKVSSNILLKEINGPSFLILISKQISITMKNPDSLRYYMFATTFFIYFFFTFINEVYYPSLCEIIFHLLSYSIHSMKI